MVVFIGNNQLLKKDQIMLLLLSRVVIRNLLLSRVVNYSIEIPS